MTRLSVSDSVHLGFAVGTGAPVAVPIQHLAVTGQTQMSGKTTTLEALVARSGLKAIAFVTKRHEASFRGEHQRVAPYFRERADWQFVSAVLEATLRERMRFERSWIMRACKGAKTLKDVQRNVRHSMKTAKGLSGDVYMTLDHYLDIVVPQIERLGLQFGSGTLTLAAGLNVMDLSGFSAELQALVIRSVIEWVYEHGSDTLVIIPEAWEFIPQNRGSPVLLACEQLIRKGGAGHNFVWLDSQDIASVHKNVLRQVGVWILGIQREANEVKRALQHIPGKKPTVDDVMQLERGQFLVCYGRTVVKTYVQPAWLDEATAREVALGEVPPLAPEPKEDIVNEQEATALREANTKLTRENDELKRRLAALEGRIARAAEDGRPPEPLLTDGYPGKQVAEAARGPTPHAPPAERGFARRELADEVYELVKERALADPKLLALFQRVPEIEVTKSVERIHVDYNSQPGVIAAMIAEGFFVDATKPAEVINELKRRGRSVHPANVSRDLGRLTEQGFLTKEADGYRQVAGMKINIVEDVAA
jgi:hypothetical protein